MSCAYVVMIVMMEHGPVEIETGVQSRVSRRSSVSEHCALGNVLTVVLLDNEQWKLLCTILWSNAP